MLRAYLFSAALAAVEKIDNGLDGSCGVAGGFEEGTLQTANHLIWTYEYMMCAESKGKGCTNWAGILLESEDAGSNTNEEDCAAVCAADKECNGFELRDVSPEGWMCQLWKGPCALDAADNNAHQGTAGGKPITGQYEMVKQEVNYLMVALLALALLLLFLIIYFFCCKSKKTFQAGAKRGVTKKPVAAEQKEEMKSLVKNESARPVSPASTGTLPLPAGPLTGGYGGYGGGMYGGGMGGGYGMGGGMGGYGGGMMGGMGGGMRAF